MSWLTETTASFQIGDTFVYQIIAVKLVIDSAVSVSRPVDMTGANAVEVDYEVIALGASVRLTVEGSNDRQNWTALSTDGTRAAPGAYVFTLTGIAFPYVRLSWQGTSSVVSAGVDTSRQ